MKRRGGGGGQASLAWVEMPYSASLYLTTAPAPAPDEIRKVGQWRAEEGCSTGRGRQTTVWRSEGGQEGCAWEICAHAWEAGSRQLLSPLISCYAASRLQLIVMAVGCENGRGSCKSKGLGL